MFRIVLIIFILLFLYPIVRGEVSLAPIIAIVTDVNSLSIGKIFNGSKDIFNNVTLYWKELLFSNLKQKVRDSLFSKPKEYIQEELARTAKNAIETIAIDPLQKHVIKPIKDMFNFTPPPSTSISSDTIYNIPVLVLKYFPLKDGKLDKSITDADYTYSFVKEKTDRITKEVAKNLSDGTRYHGYKNSGASPSIMYTVYQAKEFLTPIPKSKQFEPFPNHFKIFADANINICDYVEAKGIKEVWIWMYHTKEISPIESNMAGPHGDISNSYRQADLPVCKKTYVVYEFNYTRETAEAMESYGHQIEAVFRHVDNTLFWDKFVGRVKEEVGPRRCGNIHNPPNSTFEYDRRNIRYVETDCPNWRPEGGGDKVTLNCGTWDCDITKWHVWWMQNIPGKNNDLMYNGKKMRNWWEFIGDFDKAIEKGRSFTE